MESLQSYTLDIGDFINAYLRGEQFEHKYEITYKEMIGDIDSLMTPAPEPMILYRGVDQLYEEFQPAYTSTSTSIDIAMEFGDVVLAIHVPIGTPMIEIIGGYMDEEKEILLGRGITLQSLYEKDGIHHVAIV